MKARDSIYNVGNDYPQYIVLRRPTPGPNPEPTPGTDPIENLDISETIDGSNMTITPNGDTSTLDHYNVNVYGEG